jgi:hypothetical protein
MKTLFLALEFPHDEDAEAATRAAYEPDSAFIKHLELVVQSHYAPSIVNPVRDGVILKVADAQACVNALEYTWGDDDNDGAPRTEDERWGRETLTTLQRALAVVQGG